MSPEEKMAMRVLARAKLVPPFDLLALTKQHATVEYRSFPIDVDADGVTIGLGGTEKPHIIINSLKPETRQQFTLAHELGHVIIPWHTGIIASHVNESNSTNYEYREMEAEANRFASELLLPAEWIKENFKCNKSFSSAFKKSLETVGTSRDALLIKIFSTLDYPITCVQVLESGEVKKRYRCGGASTHENLTSLKKLDSFFSGQPVSREEFSSGDRSFVVWVVKPVKILESDSRAWREILAEIVDETGTKDHVGSINAILPMQLNMHRALDLDAMCARVMLAYQDRPKIAAAVKHPLFKQYVIKRIAELRSRSA